MSSIKPAQHRFRASRLARTGVPSYCPGHPAWCRAVLRGVGGRWGLEISLDPCAPGIKSGSGGAMGEATASEASAGGEDIAEGVPAEVVELASVSQLL